MYTPLLTGVKHILIEMYRIKMQFAYHFHHFRSIPFKHDRYLCNLNSPKLWQWQCHGTNHFPIPWLKSPFDLRFLFQITQTIGRTEMSSTNRLKRKLGELGVDTSSRRANENFCLVKTSVQNTYFHLTPRWSDRNTITPTWKIEGYWRICASVETRCIL